MAANVTLREIENQRVDFGLGIITSLRPLNGPTPNKRIPEHIVGRRLESEDGIVATNQCECIRPADLSRTVTLADTPFRLCKKRYTQPTRGGVATQPGISLGLLRHRDRKKEKRNGDAQRCTQGNRRSGKKGD